MKILSVTLLILAFSSICFADESKPMPETVNKVGSKASEPTGVSYNELSSEDKELLRKGEISQAQLLAGGFLGTFLGFGSGHLPYQMYQSRGWIFTAGEAGTLALAILGATGIDNDCTVYENGLRRCEDVGGSRLALVTGVLGFVGLRIWEIIDVWTIPSDRNYQIRAVRQKMGRELSRANWSIYPTARLTSGKKSGSAGLEFSLRF
jgi:hypothetical protein